MILTYFHQTIGFLVVVTNLIAAIWIWLLERWGVPLEGGARWALWLARGTLAIQVLIGISLVGSGGVGSTGHYLFAMVAVVASWFTYTTSRRADTNRLRTLAIGCTIVGLCAGGAYLFGRG